MRLDGMIDTALMLVCAEQSWSEATVSLAEHDDWKQGETVVMAQSKV